MINTPLLSLRGPSGPTFYLNHVISTYNWYCPVMHHSTDKMMHCEAYIYILRMIYFSKTLCTNCHLSFRSVRVRHLFLCDKNEQSARECSAKGSSKYKVRN